MDNQEIIRCRDHRPFELPEDPWVMKQVWNKLLLAHWPVRQEELLPCIPDGLELDLWEGEAWLSLIPFYITGLRLRGTPPVLWLSRFAELNVRTYVTCGGKPGIFFFSLDAERRLAVETARLLHLPYMYARMFVGRENDWITYRSERRDRRGRPAVFEALYRPAGGEKFTAQPGTLLYWLTERYRLYAADGAGKLYAGDIHHIPWELQEAELRIRRNTMAEAHGIYPRSQQPALISFAERQETLFWPIRRL
ncbi:YqjF family protein [Paenibacillus medicaginis]|uniref:YqjF family protein n=1 Tax=Paenibacillus medicaginis TaxID=1470560 RepID=A0ABV5C0G1_9BACL